MLIERNNEVEVMAHAISDVLANFAVDDGFRIDIRTRFYQSEHLKELKDAVMRKFDQKFTYEIKFDQNSRKGVYYEKSSLILLKSSDLLKYFFMATKVITQYSRSIKFLIYCENATLKNYRKLKKVMQQQKLDMFEGPIEQFVYFIFNYEKMISLGTISWFRNSSCNSPSISAVRYFDKITLKWSKNVHKYERFTHFYGCKLVMPIGIKMGINEEYKFGKYYEFNQYSDLELSLFYIMAKQYNFTPDIQKVPIVDTSTFFDIDVKEMITQMIFEKGNFPTVFFKKFHPDIFPPFALNKPQYTFPFFEAKLIFLVTPGELYTSFEKLYLPFDEPTWVLIFITFGVAFGVIFLVNFTSVSFQVLVYGHGVKIPSLNVVGTFFGIGQTKLPDLSFSRFILMIFILFCLIIRTAYQGVLFELMTSQPRRPEPKDIQGLIDQNYTVLVWHSEEFEKILSQIKNEEKNWPRFVKVDQITFENIYKTQFNNGSAKLSLILQHQTIPVFNQLGDNYIPWIQLEESYQTLLCSFVFFPNHFLYQLTNDAVQRLTSAGIMQHLYDNYIKQDLKYEKKFIEESEPQVFALSDLDFGFYVWLGTCAVAIFVFLIELLGWLPKKYGKKEISKEKIQNEVKNFIEDLGEVYENDAVEGLSKELSAPFSNDKNVTEITTEDLNEIEEIKIESRRMSENSDDENFAKIHPKNDNSKQKFKVKSLTKE
ncbi:hypothetical protein PVAND_009340 [Polypedilum vanderplanki]|uniref:Ionotropic receptor n=1 Tax=Polypedilum vanderplanki TaxID=319348 RepID=A0A9J6CCL6_POLVA|nr:hypothetical protein PVAND_009340 [Polypedilum vanderplanki]